MGSLELPTSALPQPQRVLVIGGGPAGLVTLRNLTERGSFSHVELVERRDNIGGVWYLDQPELNNDGLNKPHWPSPAYPGLIGNVLPTYLSFSSFPFPKPPNDPHQPFPTLQETHDYLRSFASPYLEAKKIRLNTEVVRVEELPPLKDEEIGGWRVVLRDWNNDGEEREERWDAVVIATGWYDNPVWPSTPGLQALRDQRIARHAKEWRGPVGFEGKKVLVIGNANSSNDICTHLAPVAHTPVYQSQRREPWFLFKSLPDERIVKVPSVERYELHEGKVNAHLADGQVLEDIDYVIVGTGYRPGPSYIHLLDRSAEDVKKHVPLITDPISTPVRIPHLHRLIVHAFNPTLGVVGAAHSYTPFTVADLISTWLALAWSRPHLSLYPSSVPERLLFEQDRLKRLEERRSKEVNPSSLVVFSFLGEDEEEYASALRREIVGVLPELGEVLPVWNKEKTEERVRMYQKKEEALKWALAKRLEGERGK